MGIHPLVGIGRCARFATVDMEVFVSLEVIIAIYATNLDILPGIFHKLEHKVREVQLLT